MMNKEKVSFVQKAASNSNTVKAVTMKRIGRNQMALAIKLTGRIFCCTTNKNAKDGKLDIL